MLRKNLLHMDNNNRLILSIYEKCICFKISLESGDFARRQASKKIKTNLLSKIENQSNKQFFVRFSEASPSPVKQLNVSRLCENYFVSYFLLFL